MKYLFGTLGLLVAAAAATGFVCYRMSSNPAMQSAVRQGDTLEWLRTDFHLDNRQFAEIRKVHESYSSVCDEHCRAIQEAVGARDALQAAGPADPAAAAAAERRLQELRAICETAITQHVRQVATLMPPGEGERYLALVLPKIAGFDHTTAPDLRLDHH